MRWVREIYVCGGGEEKERQGDILVGKKKKKEMGSGIYVYSGKKWGVEKKEREKLSERKKSCSSNKLLRVGPIYFSKN